MREYTARSGAKQYKPSFRQVLEMDTNGEGFCLACGETQAAEPDARKYICDCCGAAKVYGAAELVLMGLCYHEDDE